MKDIEWKNVSIDYEMIYKMPQVFLKEYGFLPIVDTEGNKAIAITRDMTIQFQYEISKYYKSTPIIYYSKRDELEFNLSYVSAEKSIIAITDEATIDENIENADNPVKELYEILLKRAIALKASDIHFEPFEEKTVIRYRVHGKLMKIREIDNVTYRFLSTTIKILSNMDISKKYIPHDGKYLIVYNKKNYDLRISTMPVLYGEKIVVRILNSSDIDLKLESLGFDSSSLNIIRKIINRGEGLFLVSGPTGSGKTTTLYSIINEINLKEKNVMTIEDPVEYKINGINQINLNTKAGLTFATGLRNILRQDPDVILVGEIRDEETAEIAIKAAITGHIVLSTIHTNDTISTINRLNNMGIPRHLIVDAISGIISQRLVSKLCECRKKPSKDHINESKTELELKVGACNKCIDGYIGRTLVYEMMEMDENVKNQVMSSNFLSKSVLKESLNKVTFKENVKIKYENGEIDAHTYNKFECLG